jgi:DNA-directed RNA polymerase subunit M/transcription elongation factor TFIIS
MGFLVRCDNRGEDVFPSAEMQRGTRRLLPVRNVDEVKKRYWRKLSIAASHQPKVLFVTVETIDRAEEWRRLKELYLRMSDEELEVVANDGYDLTDVARQALQGEIARRGLKVDLKNGPEPALEPEGDAVPNADELDLVSVQQVWDREQATKVKDVLNENGLPAFIGPANAENVDDFAGSFDCGVDVKVRYVDSARASAVLSRAFPRDSEEESAQGSEYVARCPKCHSDEIVFLGLDDNSPDAPDAQFNWSCDHCGYKWKDDGVEQQA